MKFDMNSLETPRSVEGREEAIALHHLPDDIIRSVLKEWLNSSSTDYLKILSTLDIAYCNHSLRPVMLETLTGMEVSVDETKCKKRKQLFQWIQGRNLKIGQVYLDQSEQSSSKRKSRRERSPLFDLLCDLHTVKIYTQTLSDLDHPTITGVVHSASRLQNIDLTLESCGIGSPSGSAMEILSRVTKLDTEAPQVLHLMKPMAPTLRELTFNGRRTSAPFLDPALWQSGIFSQLETLSISDMFYEGEDHIRRLSEHMDSADLPKLTSLSISFYNADSSSAIMRLYRFLSHRAPFLTKLELLDFTVWSTELSHALFARPPPNLCQLVINCRSFYLHVTAKDAFSPLHELVSCELENALEVLCVQAVHFALQQPSVAIKLGLHYTSGSLMSVLPWQRLSQGRLQSLTLLVNDFHVTKATWIAMFTAPTSHLDVALHVQKYTPTFHDDVVELTKTLVEMIATSVKSTVTDLSWNYSWDLPVAAKGIDETFTKTMVVVLVTVFPNLVRVDCTMTWMTDECFFLLVSKLPKLQRCAIRSSRELKLFAPNLQVLQALLMVTRCRRFTFELTLDTFLKLVLELKRMSSAVSSWRASYSQSILETSYCAQPYSGKGGRDVIVLATDRWTDDVTRCYPVRDGDNVILKKFSRL